jgi:hypothetical protein
VKNVDEKNDVRIEYNITITVRSDRAQFVQALQNAVDEDVRAGHKTYVREMSARRYFKPAKKVNAPA